MKLSGIAASEGFGVATVYKLEEVKLVINETISTNTDLDIELVKANIKLSIEQIENLKVMAKGKLNDNEIAIFDAHKMVIEDPEMLSQIISKIENDKLSAALAVQEVTNTFVTMFEQMEDAYFKERASDIKDVQKRLLSNILGIKAVSLNEINQPTVIFAEDLTPSDTAQLNEFVIGFITAEGGKTSHSAIMARSLEIAAIVGAKNCMSKVKNGDKVIIDGETGEFFINPDNDLIAKYEQKIISYIEAKEQLKIFIDKPTISADGVHFELCANIGSVNDLAGVLANGAEGVGLFRTEFLFMDKTVMPTEDEQYESYAAVLKAMDGKPVVVRTLDVGGDKVIPYIKQDHEMNPFLGNRAIRLCLSEPEILRIQARALLRASVHGNLKIMFPMIATLDEFRSAKAIVEEEKAKFIKSGVLVSDNIEIGIMVEIPSTAMMADVFAKEVDFMSIGTNDLIQYTMAADRMNEKVSYLYQPYNPAIIRMIRNVTTAMRDAGKWSGMCGEMASDSSAIPILMGLGLSEFSMSASSILKSRVQIAKLNVADIAQDIDLIVQMETAADVKTFIDNKYN